MKFYFIVVKFVVYHFVMEHWAVLDNEHKTFLFTECAYIYIYVHVHVLALFYSRASCLFPEDYKVYI